MKIIRALVVSLFVVLMLSSIVNASLDVDVSVEYSEISQNEDQIITVTSNEKGKGLLIVIQPAEGTPWIDFLNDHPTLKALWDTLPSYIQAAIIEKIGGKIVSFKIISFDSLGGGSETFTFPDDFTGINGVPSTALVGTYKVILVFLSWESTEVSADPLCHHPCCCLLEIDFDCCLWHVIPEVPFGTIISLLSAMIAIPVAKLHKRK